MGGGIDDGGGDLEVFAVVHDIAWSGEDVFDVDGGDDAEADIAIDAAEGEIIDDAPVRWYVVAFGGVDAYGEEVFATGFEEVGDIAGEGGVAALVFRGNLFAVDEDGGGNHDAIEVEESTAAFVEAGYGEVFAIPAYKAVFVLGEVVVRQFDVSVGDADAREHSFRAVCAGGGLEIGGDVEPIGVEGEDDAFHDGALC